MQAIALRAIAVLEVLVRHFSSYIELGTAAASEYRGAWTRRAIWAVVALISALAGVAATWMIGLVAFWETRWRLTYVITSAVALLAFAVIAAWAAFAARSPGPAAGVLSDELRKDKELFQEWTRTL